MRHLRFLLAALAVGAWAAGPLAGAAAAGEAAPTYQSSDPEDGAMMDHPPSEVTATFSEPLDGSSQMSVFDECGNEIDSGPAAVELNEMRVEIGKTPSGTYKVVYTAVGLAGVTGKTTGSFDFMVHHGKPCDGGGGGHDGHGNGKGKDKGHGNHGGGHDGHENGGGHDDHGGTGGPGSSGHSGHSSATAHGGDHMAAGDGGHGEHGAGHGNHGGGGNGRGSEEGPTAAGPNPTVASGPDGIVATADGQALLIGLGLALLVGLLGGWLLRTTSPPHAA
ncbi:MAG: copper resistance protein CopC [Actinomycetota bacterium]